jgi:DNA-binding protein HU-beta
MAVAFVDVPENRPLVWPRVRGRLGRSPEAPDNSRGDIIAVNKNDLISAVADEADLPKAKTAEVVDAVFAAIEAALKRKEEVRLVGFGSFATATRKASTGRNPRTGEEIKIEASTSVRFKPGKALKDAVN